MVRHDDKTRLTMKNSAQFLLKVILLSAAVSVLIKWSGTSLSVEAMNPDRLNQVATVLILLPSLILGSILALIALRSSSHQS